MLNLFKRSISVLVVLTVVFMGIISANEVQTYSVHAQEEVPYYDANGDLQSISANPIPPEDNQSITLGNGDNTPEWYYVDEEKIYNFRINVYGAANIILKNRSHLNATKGISVKEGNTLGIFAQQIYSPEDVGILTAIAPDGDDAYAGIGGNGGGSSTGGNIVINGGVIDATGGSDINSQGGAGIGGGYSGNGGSFTLNNGEVIAKRTGNAHAIGGGGDGGNVIKGKGIINLPDAYLYWYSNEGDGTKYVKNKLGEAVSTTNYDYVRIQSLSSNCDLDSLGIEGQVGDTIIDGTNITVEMPTTNREYMFSPVISINGGATISPESGVAQDFTDSVTYTVTAEDGYTTKDYVVSVQQKFDQWILDDSGKRMRLTAPLGVFAPGSEFFGREINKDLEPDKKEFKEITNRIDSKYKNKFNVIGLYELNVKNAHGVNYVKTSDYATLYIEVEAGFDLGNKLLMRLEPKDDVPLRGLRKKIIEDSHYIAADTNHFSYYALMDEATSKVTNKSPMTGDSGWLWVEGIIAILIITAAYLIMTYRKKLKTQL